MALLKSSGSAIIEVGSGQIKSILYTAQWNLDFILDAFENSMQLFSKAMMSLK